MTDLWYGGDRHDVVGYLERHVWSVASTDAAESVAYPGISTSASSDGDAENFAGISYVSATRQ